MEKSDWDYDAWFESLFAEWYLPLCRFAFSILEPLRAERPTGHEEAVQDAFMVLWEKHSQLYAHPNIDAWLFKAVSNKASDRLKRATTRARYDGPSLDYPDAAEPVIAPGDTESLVLLKEQHDTIIGLLGEEDYGFLLAYYDKSIPKSHLAAQQGVSQSGLRSRVHRIIAPLRSKYFSLFLVLFRNV